MYKVAHRKKKKRDGGGVKGKRNQTLKGRNYIPAKGKSGSDLKSFQKRKKKERVKVKDSNRK